MAVDRISLLLLGILALSATVIRCDDDDGEPEKDGDVFILTKDNFEATVMDKDTFLVEFYAPWCGHCKAMAPAYSAAATKLKEKGVFVGKVDCTKEKSLAKDFNIKGYPTLKFFKKGTAYEYEGPREEEGKKIFLKYIHSKNKKYF